MTNAAYNALDDISPSLGGREQARRTFEVFFPRQLARLEEIHSVKRTEARYGPDERQTLDIYTDPLANARRPIVVFVHGGGFSAGDKRMNEAVYSNIGHFFVNHGYACVTINYRLFPAHAAGFPSGGEDVGLALSYLKNRHANELDVGRIFLFGSSAGAFHAATYLWSSPDAPWPKTPLAGFICANLPADFEAAEGERSSVLQGYLGLNFRRFKLSDLLQQSRTEIPTLFVLAEHDLEAEVLEPNRRLLTVWRGLEGQKQPETLTARGHNHFSVPVALGLGAPYDDWTAELLAWMRDQ